jgi:predicted alpha/beta superfamily hydrolase
MLCSRFCLAALMLHASLLLASPPAAAETAAPVEIPRSQTHDIRDAQSGAVYRLFLWRPATPPPPAGYPVVYLLDGNSSFGTATDIIDARSRRAAVTGMTPAVIVGIGYPTDAPFDQERRTLDLTPPADPDTLPRRPNGAPWPSVGGADAFLRFIEQEIKPLVASLYPVDSRRETLMGHSFGGLFTLHVFLTRPDAFSTYVANSPSLWFADRRVLKDAARFAATPPRWNTPPRLMVSVGGLEQSLSDAEAALPDADRRRAWKEGNRMVDNCRDLATLLQDVPGLSLRYAEFPDEDHLSVLPTQLSRGLGFALSP